MWRAIPSESVLLRFQAKLVLILLALLTLGATPQLPNLPSPKPDDIARFKMEMSGNQVDSETFYREPAADGCSLHMKGTLKEDWRFSRHNTVTMEFRKYGNKVYLQRGNRPFGDSAFATQGRLQRWATGFLNIKNGPGCQSFDLVDPICGKNVKSPLDLRLDYSGGFITLKGSGPSAAKPNPLELCGVMPAGGTSFNHLTYPYPLMLKQKGRLSARQIFGKTKEFNITLKPRFLEPVNEEGFTTFDEEFEGDSSLTLTRR